MLGLARGRSRTKHETGKSSHQVPPPPPPHLKNLDQVETVHEVHERSIFLAESLFGFQLDFPGTYFYLFYDVYSSSLCVHCSVGSSVLKNALYLREDINEKKRFLSGIARIP